MGHGRDQPREQGGGVPEELWALRHRARLHQIRAGTKDHRGVAVFKKDETTDSVGRKVALKKKISWESTTVIQEERVQNRLTGKSQI